MRSISGEDLFFLLFFAYLCLENPPSFLGIRFFSSPTFGHNFHKGCHIIKGDTTKSCSGATILSSASEAVRFFS